MARVVIHIGHGRACERRGPARRGTRRATAHPAIARRDGLRRVSRSVPPLRFHATHEAQTPGRRQFVGALRAVLGVRQSALGELLYRWRSDPPAPRASLAGARRGRAVADHHPGAIRRGAPTPGACDPRRPADARRPGLARGGRAERPRSDHGARAPEVSGAGSLPRGARSSRRTCRAVHGRRAADLDAAPASSDAQRRDPRSVKPGHGGPHPDVGRGPGLSRTSPGDSADRERRRARRARREQRSLEHPGMRGAGRRHRRAARAERYAQRYRRRRSPKKGSRPSSRATRSASRWTTRTTAIP